MLFIRNMGAWNEQARFEFVSGQWSVSQSVSTLGCFPN